MTAGSTHATTLGFATTGLASWMLMFAAVHDIWHETARPDLAQLPGVHRADLHGFVVTFYALPFVLVVQLAVTAVGVIRSRRTATVR